MATCVAELFLIALCTLVAYLTSRDSHSPLKANDKVISERRFHPTLLALVGTGAPAVIFPVEHICFSRFDSALGS